MSDVFFTSDTHFFHKNIIRFSNRPYKNVQEMNEGLIENWNKVVKPTDDVYHLGDFALDERPRAEEVINRLNGKIHFIYGNHDHGLPGNFVERVHYKEIKVHKQWIVLFHFGMRVWHGNHRGTWHLYGHSHGTLPPFGKSVDVGVDSPWVTGMCGRPFSFEEIKTFMNKQNVQIVDHHGVDNNA